jgi:bacteriocin biosynthesis cyclodehydratase domain-containing protein
VKDAYFRPVLTNGFPSTEQRAQISSYITNSKLVDALIPLLDGSNSLEEIYANLMVLGFDTKSTFAAMNLLDEKGLIHEAQQVDGLTMQEMNRYKSQMLQLASLASRGYSQPRRGIDAQISLIRSTVVIASIGMAGAELMRALALAGVRKLIGVRDDHQGPPKVPDDLAGFQREVKMLNPLVEFTSAVLDNSQSFSQLVKNTTPNLLVYCPDYFDEELCERLNQISLDNSVPFLLYRQRITEVSLGPLVIPRSTACYICYDRRRKATRFDGEIEAHSDASAITPRFNFPLGIDLLALDAIKFLAGVSEPVTQGRLWRLDLISGLMEVHPVLKLPRCPACGVHKSKPMRKLWEE